MTSPLTIAPLGCTRFALRDGARLLAVSCEQESLQALRRHLTNPIPKIVRFPLSRARISRQPTAPARSTHHA